MFKLEISIGNIFTAFAVFVSAAGLVVAWTKDRNLRRKVYSDQIRQAAATTIAKIERWQQISVGFFNDLQPLITEADMELVKNQDIIKVRDFFWCEVTKIHARMIRYILNEKIEIAYSQIFGYEHSIYGLFKGAVERLRRINELMLLDTLLTTQQTIRSIENAGEFKSSVLGNLLRSTCSEMHLNTSVRMEMVLEPFRKEVLKIITGGDQDIEKRKIRVKDAESVLPSLESIQGRR